MRGSSGLLLDRQIDDDQARRSGAPRVGLRSARSRTPRGATRTSSGRAATSTSDRVAARHSRQRRVRIPRASARSEAARITGPSASGSEKGKPSSIRSAPPSTAASRELGRLGAGHEVDDESLLHALRARTSSRSLSPRPERQTRTSSASRSAPGERVRRLERGDDSLRLREPVEGGERLVVRARTVLARPLSRRNACSGPTPG